MWIAKPTILDKNVHKINLFDGDKSLLYVDVIRYWLENIEFRDFYFSILRDSPFEAFFWENPAVAKSNLKQAYEFVLVNSPQLAGITADPSPFEDNLKSLAEDQGVVRFENLGRDAELIVPRPVATQNAYAHIASFIRTSPESQRHGLFMLLADSLNKRINDEPTWVSTSGLGVYWLHIRLDTRPKYYTYQPYRHYSE